MPENHPAPVCDGRIPLAALAPNCGYPSDSRAAFPGRTAAQFFPVYQVACKSMSAQGVLYEYPHLLDCVVAFDRRRPERYQHSRPGPRWGIGPKP